MNATTRSARHFWPTALVAVFLASVVSVVVAAQPWDAVPRQPVAAPPPRPREAERLPLTGAERQVLDETVDKALAFIASRQNADGSFQSVSLAEPAVTSLCVMAFLSRGHKPGGGPYGGPIERAIDYVLEMQDPETGAIMPRQVPGPPMAWSRAGNYNHGICGIMLADVYPLTGRQRFQRDEGTRSHAEDDRRHNRIEKAVKRALAYTRDEQLKTKIRFGEQGGWRYVESNPRNDSDLSVSAWMIMFLHSAQKSGFKVPATWMKGALRFVHRAFDKRQGGFVYVLSEGNGRCTRATVGAGILCLLLGGEPVTTQVKVAAEWIRRHPFTPYNQSTLPADRYHYSAFYCSQAMGLLGGAYFRDFYPELLQTLSTNQRADGSWEPESLPSDTSYGRVYTTALAVLALSPPYEMLKTYQR